jgi:hypothetical protein
MSALEGEVLPFDIDPGNRMGFLMDGMVKFF